MKDLNIALLDTINSIDTSYHESETAYVESLIDFYNKETMFIEYCDVSTIDDMIIQEGSSEGFLSKILNGIKKFIKAIVESIKKIFNSFRNKATTNTAGNNPIESVSAIAAEVLEANKSKNKADNIDGWSIPKPNPKFIKDMSDIKAEVKDDKKEDDKKEEKEEVKSESYVESLPSEIYLEAENATNSGSKVTIPADPKSEIKGETVELKNNELTISYINNNKTLKITYLGFGYLSNTKVKSEDNPENDIKGQKDEWYQSPKLALHLMTHDETRNKITKLVNLALKVMKERKAEDISELKKSDKIATIVKIILKPESHIYEVPLSQLTAVQSWATQLLESMDAFTSTNVNLKEFDSSTIKSLNGVVTLLMRIQISLNFISTALGRDNMLLIDKKFYKSIKSLDVLDEFVGRMIKAGVPPKYVAYNSWLISDECIRGDGEYKPCFGHARATFFPPNKKIVLKVGLSGLGTVSNETEIRFSKIFEDMDRVDLIAPIVKEFKNNAIIAMERVDGNFDLSKAQLTNYAKTASKALEDYQTKTGKKLNVKLSVASQHIGNVAYDNKYKCYRSIDYGIHYREPNKK